MNKKFKTIIIYFLYLIADITLLALIVLFCINKFINTTSYEEIATDISAPIKNDNAQTNNIQDNTIIQDNVSEKNKDSNIIQEDMAEENQSNTSVVYDAYLEAININESELIKDQLSTTYHDIKINADELQYLEDGAIYRSLARKIEGFYMETTKNNYTSNYDNYIQLICGIECQPTYDEMKVYVDKAHLVVTEENALQSIMSTFQQTEGISGNFDFENNIFDFEIYDLKMASSQLGISETMLGYTLAMLNEYGPSTEFGENSYKCTWLRSTF